MLHFAVTNHGPLDSANTSIVIYGRDHAITATVDQGNCSDESCDLGYLAAGQTATGNISILPSNFTREFRLQVRVAGSELDMNQGNNDRSVSLPIHTGDPERNATVLWSTLIERPGNLSVDGDHIYLTSKYYKDTELFALDKGTGRKLWQLKLPVSFAGGGSWGGPVVSGPHPHGDLLLIGYAPGYLDAVDKDTGMLRWRFQSDKLATPVPLVHQNTIYLTASSTIGPVTSAGTVYSLDLETGTVIWEREMDRNGSISTELRIGDGGNLYFSYFTDDGNFLYAVDARTGTVKWRHDSWSASITPAADKVVYMGNGINALAGLSGEPQWRYKVDTLGRVPRLTAKGGWIAFCASSELHFIGEETGEQAWRAELEAECPWDQTNMPVVVEDTVYFGTSGKKGALHSFNATTGELRWKVESETAGDILLKIYDGRVYFSLNGDLGAVRLANGDKLWAFNADGHPLEALAPSEGSVYAIANKRVFAVR